MRFIRIVLSCLSAFLFISTGCQRTAEDVIGRYVEVTGRKHGLDSVNTLAVKRSAYNPDTGDTSYLAVYSKRPDWVRMERRDPTGAIRIFAYDGGRAWSANVDPITSSYNNVRDIPQDNPLFDILFKGTDFDDNLDGRFVDFEERGAAAEYLGKEAVDGKKVHHIKMTWEDGRVVDYHFDAATGLILKHWDKDSEGRTHSSLYLDYREAGGILIPYTRINKGPLRDNPNGTIEEKILEVKMNIPLEDSLFLKPAVENTDKE